jgi:hypothetical protein
VSYAKFGCRSDLYFEHPDPVVNLARWRLLYRRKDDVVAALGGELTFDELPNNKGCRIEARLNGWRWSLARRRRGRIDLLSRTEEVSIRALFRVCTQALPAVFLPWKTGATTTPSGPPTAQ